MLSKVNENSQLKIESIQVVDCLRPVGVNYSRYRLQFDYYPVIADEVRLERLVQKRTLILKLQVRLSNERDRL